MIFVGREGRTESYQLLIDCSYIPVSYEGSPEREIFFESLSKIFVRRLLEENKNLEIRTFNGLRINPETGEYERILKLDEMFVNQLGYKIINRYARVRQIIPAPSLN